MRFKGEAGTKWSRGAAKNSITFTAEQEYFRNYSYIVGSKDSGEIFVILHFKLLLNWVQHVPILLRKHHLFLYSKTNQKYFRSKQVNNLFYTKNNFVIFLCFNEHNQHCLEEFVAHYVMLVCLMGNIEVNIRSRLK